jgi:hypothetical protein
VAAWTAYAARRVPVAVRVGLALLAMYGIAAFLAGARASIPVTELLSGRSLWSTLPRVLQGAFVGGLIALPIALVVSIVHAGLRRPPGGSLRSTLWQVIAVASSLAIVLAALPLSGNRTSTLVGQVIGTEPAPLTSAQRESRLTGSLRALEEADRDLSRDRWDAAYVASSVGSDPDRLFAWVRTHTIWVPYRGVLRGATGVLMDRRGNALDRALLLAELLRSAKHTVRLAHGSLTIEQAAGTLRTLFQARRELAAAAVPPTDVVVSAAAQQYQLDDPAIRQAIAARANATAATQVQITGRVNDQTGRLASAMVRPSPDDARWAVFKRTVTALQDHWWVQIQDQGGWRDLDLTASDGKAIVTAAGTVDVAAVPADLHHDLIVRVIGERWAADGLTERVALEQPLRPADLIGQPVLLQFTPLRPPTQPPMTDLGSVQALRTAAIDAREWAPVLNIGGRPLTQSGFFDTGELSKPGLEEIITQSGRDTAAFARGAVEAFGGAPEAPKTTAPATHLTAVWIEYEIRSPGEPAQRVRREVFDLIGPAARASGHVPAPAIDREQRLVRGLSLMMATEILPVVCRVPPEFVAHLAAQTLLANRDVVNAAARSELPSDFAHAQDLSKRFAGAPTPLYRLAYARMAWSPSAAPTFVDRTNILTRHVFFAPAGNGVNLFSATDIVANEVGVDLAADDPFDVRLQQGVLDTNAEALLASDRPDAANAGWAFTSPAGWITLRSKDDPQLTAVQLSADIRQRILADLAAGYSVVAPSAPVTVGAERFSGWWRVNPATGQALGVDARGWGASMVERALIQAFVSGGTAFLFSYLWCQIRAEGAPAVGRAEPASYFVTPVHAAPNACVVNAVQDAIIAFLAAAAIGLGAAAAAGARGGGGAPGGGGNPGRGGPPGGGPPGGGPPGGNPPGGAPPGGAPPGGGPPGNGPPPGNPGAGGPKSPMAQSGGGSPPDLTVRDPAWADTQADAATQYRQALEKSAEEAKATQDFIRQQNLDNPGTPVNWIQLYLWEMAQEGLLSIIPPK